MLCVCEILGGQIMTAVIEVTEKNFKNEVLDCDVPVLVDFYSDGCGPCEMIAPFLDELAVEYGDKMKITKFHVKLDEVLEQTNEVVKEFEIMGFPTLLIFRNRVVTNSHLGGLHKAELAEFLASAIQ